MPSQEEFDELKGRLEKLENHVAGAATPQFTDEELAAFKKVSSAMADTGDFCGINDCFRPRLCSTVDFCGINDCFRPRLCSTVCSVCRTCWTVCIFECTCGPCNLGGFNAGGVQRFNGLGG